MQSRITATAKAIRKKAIQIQFNTIRARTNIIREDTQKSTKGTNGNSSVLFFLYIFGSQKKYDMRTKLFVATMMLCALCACSKSEPGKVKVEGGWIQGTVTDGLAIYKGIPFAAPPVGDLRWKAPQPVQKWEGVKDATKFGPGPMQNGNPSDYSEDCLYLNVWSPAKSANEKLPVLVWIYGGGFSMGNTADPSYDCEALARKGGIIMASINYRVGQMGFFSHPELDAESPSHTSGNYGLLDQIAGLQWIQRNIAKFGGDPDKVTIFGESAGGISVSMLCASPLAKGLFCGAISESGGSFGPYRPTTYPGENMQTLEQAEKGCLAVAERLGAKSLKELRELDAKSFLSIGMGGGGGWPIVDGYVIPDDQFVLYEAGKYNDVNVLIGYNSDEGASFSFGGRATPESHRRDVETRYGKFADALLEAYPLENGQIGKTARDLTRDAAFGWQTWSWARLQSKTGKSKVFLYYFDQHPDYPEGSPRYGNGSPHGQEVAFVFQHIGPRSDQPESDAALSDAMGTYWLNFAKYGTPNAPDSKLPEWPEFNNDNPQVMVLTGPVPHVGPVPSESSLKVLDKYFEWRRTPEGRAWAK